jgi:hypothetical protein
MWDTRRSRGLLDECSRSWQHPCPAFAGGRPPPNGRSPRPTAQHHAWHSSTIGRQNTAGHSPPTTPAPPLLQAQMPYLAAPRAAAVGHISGSSSSINIGNDLDIFGATLNSQLLLQQKPGRMMTAALEFLPNRLNRNRSWCPRAAAAVTVTRPPIQWTHAPSGVTPPPVNPPRSAQEWCIG